MLLTVLLTLTASAGPDGPDLPTMARDYGWGAVASVVQAVSTGDVSNSQAHAQLAALGLDRVQVRVVVDGALDGVGPLGPLTGCGWNDGVTCGLELPAGTPVPLAWTPRCANARGLVDGSFIGPPLTVVVEPRPTADAPGRAHVGDVQTCWLAGGDRVRLVPVGAAPPPRPTLLSADGLDEPEARALLDAHAAALAACMQGHGTITLDYADDGSLAEAVVKRDGGIQEAETACVRAALAASTVRAGRSRIVLVLTTK